MDNINNIINSEKGKLDIFEILGKIWQNKKFVAKCCGFSAILGVVVAFSIPKEYTTKVTLASEATQSSSNSSMMALANIAGINLNRGNTKDALSPLIYPDIVYSTSFNIQLFDIPVILKGTDESILLKDYLKEHQKEAWWNNIMKFPFKILGWVVSLFSDKKDIEPHELNPFMLNSNETSLIKTLRSLIKVSLDKKTSVLSIDVTMQDPLVSAIVADSVTSKLQSYITEYRTSKAKIDLEFAQKLYDKAKSEYYSTMEKYAEYLDRNQNIMQRRNRIQEEKLNNEMQLAYNVYTQSAQQLQLAQVKVQENTPIFAKIQPPTVPIKPIKPSKLTILVGFIFLGFFLSSIWTLVHDNFCFKKFKF